LVTFKEFTNQIDWEPWDFELWRFIQLKNKFLMDLFEKISVPNRRRIEWFLGILSFSLPAVNLASLFITPLDQHFHPYYWTILGVALFILVVLLLFTRIEFYRKMLLCITSDITKYVLLNLTFDLMYSTAVSTHEILIKDRYLTTV
jgi:hypothetical protein